MSKSKHTPSEWSGSPCPVDPDNFWICDATGERVHAVAYTQAEARLIAEAPAMLEALRDLIAWDDAASDAAPFYDWDRFHVLTTEARAILARIDGEG